MKIINLSEHSSLLNQFTSELRNIHVQNDRARFRHNVTRIGNIIAYEMSKTLRSCTQEIQTPLGVATTTVPNENIVLATILRAGLPFHQGFLEYFENAENSFVSAYRKYISQTDFEIRIEYLASPDLNNKTLIISDPMLATGSSMELCYKALLTKGNPSSLHIAAVIATVPALEYISKIFPEETTVWCAAIDPELNAHAYIVPGLGDAGDLCYGEKS